VIALDTNILVRYFVRDDPVQAERARAYVDAELSEDNPGFVSLVVLAELDWVCRRVYRLAAADVRMAIRKLTGARQIVIESEEMVKTALESGHDDLADQLIDGIGRAVGCTHTVTFDRKFARLDGVELLK
jgi:predicted nucleic-acid-binding protein